MVFAPRLLPEGTWRSARGLPTAVLLRGLTSGTYFTVEALVPLMLITERRVAAVTVGVAFTASAVLWAVASWVQGKLLQDVARHRLVTVGALIMAASVAFAVVGSFSGVSPLLAMAAMPLAAVGMGMLDPCVTVLSLAHSAPDRLGHTTSAMQTNMNLGQVVVLAFATAVLNAGLAAGTSRLRRLRDRLLAPARTDAAGRRPCRPRTQGHTRVTVGRNGRVGPCPPTRPCPSTWRPSG